MTPCRNGRASVSRIKGCVFETPRGHENLLVGNQFDSQAFRSTITLEINGLGPHSNLIKFFGTNLFKDFVAQW